MSAQVSTSLKGRVAEVVLDRPEKHNVLDLGGWLALADAFDELSKNVDIGCVIVRGCLLYTSPSPRDKRQSRMPSSA